MFANVLDVATGPGIVGIHGDSQYFVLSSGNTNYSYLYYIYTTYTVHVQVTDHMALPYHYGVVWSTVDKTIKTYGYGLRSSEMQKRACLVNFNYFVKQCLCYLTNFINYICLLHYFVPFCHFSLLCFSKLS